MPQMADITIKASNGTTDVVLVAKAPSAGDQTPAVWQVDAASTRQAFRPTVQLRTSSNGPRTARNVRLREDYPILETINGVETITARVPFELTATLPTNVPSAQVKEAIYQFGNLVVASLIRASMETGYAPT